jgi:hypothetical protein
MKGFLGSIGWAPTAAARKEAAIRAATANRRTDAIDLSLGAGLPAETGDDR